MSNIADRVEDIIVSVIIFISLPILVVVTIILLVLYTILGMLQTTCYGTALSYLCSR